MRNVFFEGVATPVDITQLASQLNAISAGTVSDRRYYNDMVLYTAADNIESNCAEISFYNIGTTTMYVNGIPFAPLAGIAFDGKENEMDVTKYKLNFTGAGVNNAFVIRKVYV